MANVAGMQPAVFGDGGFCGLVILPVSHHDKLAARQDLAILGDLYLNVFYSRANGFERGVVATIDGDQGRSLCLAIALEDFNADGLKVEANLLIQRRAA